MVTDRAGWAKAEVSRQNIIADQSDGLAAIAFNRRTAACVCYLNTVITRWQIVEGILTVCVGQHHVQNRDRSRRTQAIVERYQRTRDPAFNRRILRPVLVIVRVNRVTDGHVAEIAKVSRQRRVCHNSYVMTLQALKLRVARLHRRNHTVITVWNAFEQVIAVRVADRRTPPRRQRGQISRTSTNVQLNQCVRQRNICCVERAVRIGVNIRLVTNLTGRREAKVCCECFVFIDGYRMALEALEELTAQWVGRHHTVVTNGQSIEQVETIGIRQHRLTRKGQGRQVRWTQAIVKLDHHVFEHNISRAVNIIAVRIDVRQVAD